MSRGLKPDEQSSSQSPRALLGLADTVGERISSSSLLMDEPVRSILALQSKRLVVQRRELLIRQDDVGSSAYLVQQGGLLLFRTNESGIEIGLDWLGPSEACGLEDALCNQLYCFSARATVQSILWRIFAADLYSLFDEHPILRVAIVRYLGVRHRVTASQLELLGLDSVAERVRRTLQRLVLRFGSLGNEAHLPLTQGDLAVLVGASRQAVNRALGALSESGAIMRSGRNGIHVADVVHFRGG